MIETYARWRRDLLERHPDARIETMSDERGVVGAVAFKSDGSAEAIGQWDIPEHSLIPKPKMTSTTVRFQQVPWGQESNVSVIHRADLSDLAEPYLSLVRDARDPNVR